MRTVVFDTETYPFYKVGKATCNVVPRLVCMSYMIGEEGPFVVERERAIPLFRDWLLDPETRLVGHNVTFDVLVMTRALTEEYGGDWAKAVRDLYAQQRVHDTIIYRQLRRIATNGTTKNTSYTLAYMVQRYLKIKVEGKNGEDVWRARYNELDGVIAEKYPDRAYQYAALDAKYTREMWLAMTDGKHYTNESFQLCADLALRLQSSHGFLVDQEHTEWIYAHYAKKLARLNHFLSKHDILRDDGTADTEAVQGLFETAWRSIGRPPMLTDSGKSVSTSKKALEELENAGYFKDEANNLSQEIMYGYSEYKTTNKFIATYLEPLQDAGEYPVCTRYTTVVDSGRTSSSGPNVQNFPARLNADERRAKAEGFEGPFGKDIRGCVIPREGKCFLVADYSAIELAALAQVIANIAGEVTELGKTINSGADGHIYLLSRMVNQDYDKLLADYKDGDDWADRNRFMMKAANYAFGGGAGAATFVDYCAGMGLRVTEAEAVRAYNAYHSTYPDVERYHFEDIKRCETRPGRYEVELHGPNRTTSGWMMRVCSELTQAYNTRFQSLTGAGFKYAAWNLFDACYCNEESILYGSRPILSIHDEFVTEAERDGKEQLRLEEMQRIMVESMSLFIPDIVVAAEGEIKYDRWSK